MPENPTNALVKTVQSPALARVSSQLALLDKLLTKPEEPFFIPYRKGNDWENKWGFWCSATRIVPQQNLLFLTNDCPHGNPPTFIIQFCSCRNIKREFNNRTIVSFIFAYACVNEQELLSILRRRDLLVGGELVASIEDIPEEILQKNDEGYNDGYHVVCREEYIPQYENQPVAGSLSRKKTYVDEKGNTYYKNGYIYFPDGYIVRDKEKKTVYNTDQHFDFFVSQWKNGNETDLPGCQAVRNALFNKAINPESEWILLGSDKTGRFEIPKSSFLNSFSRTMTDEEEEMHIKWSQCMNIK